MKVYEVELVIYERKTCSITVAVDNREDIEKYLHDMDDHASTHDLWETDYEFYKPGEVVQINEVEDLLPHEATLQFCEERDNE